MKDTNTPYDVVIIGGGVSGLTSSAFLTRAGLKVAVLEMDARPGGYLAGFRRKDFRFDSAIHWLNQCGERGFVYRIFGAIGQDFPKTKTHHQIRRYIVGNKHYMLTSNPDELRDDLIRDFPHERKGLMKFFAVAKRMAGAFEDYATNFRDLQTRNLFGKALFGMKLARFGLTFVPHVFYNGEEGVIKGLNKYFKDKTLHKLWDSEDDLLSCLIPIAWAYNQDYQLPPEGGSQVFPEWLAHVTTSLGSEIHYQTKATEIVIENKRAIGVKAHRKGEELFFPARYVVAACDVEALYERLLPRELSDPKFLERLKNADLYSSAVTLSIGLNCTAEELGFTDEMILIARDDVKRSDHNGGDPELSDLSLLAPSVRDKSLAPEGKGTLTIYSPAYFHQYDNWGIEYDENGEIIRGEKYQATKKEYADIVLKRVEQSLGVSIVPHIEYLDIATPVTHYRYTGNRNGSMMGARPGKTNYQAKIAHYKTPVNNVFLSGHWANLGGGVPIAVSTAANSSLLILKQEKHAIFNKLGNYFDGKISATEFYKTSGLVHYPEDWIQAPTPAVKKRLRQASTD